MGRVRTDGVSPPDRSDEIEMLITAIKVGLKEASDPGFVYDPLTFDPNSVVVDNTTMQFLLDTILEHYIYELYYLKYALARKGHSEPAIATALWMLCNNAVGNLIGESARTMCEYIIYDANRTPLYIPWIHNGPNELQYIAFSTASYYHKIYQGIRTQVWDNINNLTVGLGELECIMIWVYMFYMENFGNWNYYERLGNYEEGQVWSPFGLLNDCGTKPELPPSRDWTEVFDFTNASNLAQLLALNGLSINTPSNSRIDVVVSDNTVTITTGFEYSGQFYGQPFGNSTFVDLFELGIKDWGGTYNNVYGHYNVSVIVDIDNTRVASRKIGASLDYYMGDNNGNGPGRPGGFLGPTTTQGGTRIWMPNGDNRSHVGHAYTSADYRRTTTHEFGHVLGLIDGQNQNILILSKMQIQIKSKPFHGNGASFANTNKKVWILTSSH